jgi:hypothetical protein
MSEGRFQPWGPAAARKDKGKEAASVLHTDGAEKTGAIARHAHPLPSL